MKKIFVLLLVWLGLTALALADGTSDDADVVFLGDKKPMLLRIRTFADGQSLEAQGLTFLRKWFAYLDANSDGKLDNGELRRTYKRDLFTNALRFGAFYNNTNQNLSAADFGKAGPITFEDLRKYYAPTFPKIEFANVQSVNNGDAVTEAFFKKLDADNNGKLSKDEVLAARTVLARLDANDDELISIAEMNPVTNANGLRPARPVEVAMMGAQPGAVPANGIFVPLTRATQKALFAQLLKKYAAKSERLDQEALGVDDETFAILDQNRNGEVGENELMRWSEAEAFAEWVVHRDSVNKKVQVDLSLAGKRAADPYGLLLGEVEVRLKLDSLFLPQGDNSQFFVTQLRQVDKNERGYIEVADLQSPAGNFLKNQFPSLDMNSDGKLTEKEVQAYFALAREGSACTVKAVNQEEGRGLFSWLDLDRDGRLSPRELLSAWDRLQKFDPDKTGHVDLKRIPRQFNLQIARGVSAQAFGAVDALGRRVAPTMPEPLKTVPTPAWYRKMDANGDGEVSRREFLGPAETYDRIDLNKDGLIDPAEAILADVEFRKLAGK